jgi:cytochrome d ubiquinol oxidase subunit I
MDALLLSRAQFAANISFHILFPTITIALGWLLFFFRWRWLRTRDAAWLQAWRFWTKVFALSFALGVVSGITMSFQFGTNWPGYMERVGNIAGPLLGYEVLTAFFLEATFLGVMLFGHGRVSDRTQLVATFLVAFGTTLSAFWILSLNSWMQTPAGHRIDPEGHYHVVSWFAVVFNPSFPYRLAHMLLASFLTASFLIAGLSAWQLLKGTATPATAKSLRTGITVAALLVPVQIVVGDLHGLNTLKHQPAKVAAMEAVWETQRGAPLLLFAWPDEAVRKNRWAIGIPRGASLILGHSLDAEIEGLNDFRGEHPPVAPVFFAFRVMVGMGLLMLATSWACWWLLRRRAGAPERLPRALLWTLAGMTFSGWVATLAGWYVTEIGRQPFVVFGFLRTAEVVTTTPASHVAVTLVGYVVLYAALILAYVAVLKYMAEHVEEAAAEEPGHSSEAVAAAAAGATGAGR